jgi:hypothetical protein
MPGVRWSGRAEAKLRTIDPAVRDQLIGNAARILHDIPPIAFPHDEGFAGEIMWHRGIVCGLLSEELMAQEDADGPWNYFLFYAPRRQNPGDPHQDEYFEVLDICGISDVAEQWKKMRGEAS